MQILYDFDQLPQTLLLNPGANVDYDKHIGFPLLSNVYLMGGSSNREVNYNNLILDTESNTEILENLKELGLNENEVFVFNQQIEILNAGIRLRDSRYYLSFGMYQQMDGFSSYPVDLVDLFLYGNDQDQNGEPEYNENFNAKDVNSIYDLIGVFHIGISKRVSEKLTIGGRLKLLSGSLGVETGSNAGSYYLGRGSSAQQPYVHNFEGMSVRMNSSGLLDPSDLSNDIGSISELVSGLFFMNGNFGASVDLGFSYQVDDNLSFSGSLLDVGMISFQHKLATIELEDDVIETDEYYDPYGAGLEYWRDLWLSDQLPLETDEKGFSSYRSPKLNAAVKYETKRKVKQAPQAFRNVRGDLGTEYLSSAYGLQVFTEFRPKYPIWALTGFYSRELTKYLSMKATYTVDKFSYYNIGLGFSTHIKSFNFYATADNLVALTSIKNSNYQSFQFGMNFIFN